MDRFDTRLSQITTISCKIWSYTKSQDRERFKKCKQMSFACD
jgi:uncharacterized protein with HEPN domain